MKKSKKEIDEEIDKEFAVFKLSKKKHKALKTAYEDFMEDDDSKLLRMGRHAELIAVLDELGVPRHEWKLDWMSSSEIGQAVQEYVEELLLRGPE